MCCCLWPFPPEGESGEQWAEVHALRDTGNLLRDPMSQKRVMVVEKSCLVPLLSREERQALEKAIDEEDLMDDLKEFKKLDKKSTAKDDEE